MARQEFDKMTHKEKMFLLADVLSDSVKDLAKEVAHRKRTAKMELGISFEEFDQAWDLAYKTACLKFDQMSDIEFKLAFIVESIEKGVITVEDLGKRPQDGIRMNKRSYIL